MDIFAVTVNSEHTLVIVQEVARLTEAALLAGRGDFGTGVLTVGIQIGTGRWAGGKAVSEVAVVWALQSWGCRESRVRGDKRGPKAKAIETRLGTVTKEIWGSPSMLSLFILKTFTEHGPCGKS